MVQNLRDPWEQFLVVQTIQFGGSASGTKHWVLSQVTHPGNSPAQWHLTSLVQNQIW